MFYTCQRMTPSTASEAPSHQAIIERAGGSAALGRLIEVDPNTVKAWKRLNSIPAAYWHAMANAEAATLDELAEAAARKAAA
jgi:hypothetical protein